MSRSLLVLTFATLSLLLCGCPPKGPKVTPAKAREKTPVEVMEVKNGLLERRGNYFGVVNPRADITISAELPGVVVELPVDQGATVEASTTLLRLDSRQYEIALAQAEQNLEAAKLSHERMAQNLEIEKKRLEASLSQAEGGVEAAQANLRLVENGARPEEKKQIKAAQDASRANFKNAEAQYLRVKQLFEAGASTKQQFDAAEAAFKATDAELRRATLAWELVEKGAREENRSASKAALRQAEAMRDAAKAAMDTLELRKSEVANAAVQSKLAELALDGAKLALSKTTLTPRIEEGAKAVVAKRFVDLGETVGVGTPLFNLLLMDRPKAVFYLPGKEMGQLKEGSGVDLRCTGEDKPRAAKVTRMALNSNPQNSTFDVEVELDNRDGKLRAGQICEAFPIIESYRLPLVPDSAVTETEGGKLVMVEVSGTAREQRVVVAAVQNAVAAIKEGLKPGDRVITEGSRLVNDGDQVTVSKIQKGLDSYLQGDPESPWEEKK
jgi:RND family efflux transporter MFP subunit